MVSVWSRKASRLGETSPRNIEITCVIWELALSMMTRPFWLVRSASRAEDAVVVALRATSAWDDANS